ncbi:MAG: saccharopine dehydrogenase NADP-binding domain-containing protein [Candidatus Heimdallarchaeota archaeon]|nr:MAG: saccharopine dehydrogenase NADP-binding domain-containing protein [Candidatus Heimdallarchaeota archaeon]
MKLLILGGAGDMGSYIVKDAVKFGTMWTEIGIADINEKKATQLMSQLKDSRLNFVKVDATNHIELVHLMKNYDIACSAIGPFYFFGPKIARAAIEAKIPLVDICDDPDPTQEVLEMDIAAKEASIPIFIGYGWTPGLTNLMALRAYNKLDTGPVRFNISWAGGAADSEGFAVILHVYYAVTGSFPSYQNGKFINAPAGKGNVKIDFPLPINKVNIFDWGHPEPVSIPRFLPNVTECTLKGGLTPDWNNKVLESFKHLHLIQGRSRQKFWAKVIHATEKLFATGGIPASSARVDIFGSYNDKPVHWVYCTPSIAMGELTGIPAAIAAQFYAEGKISGTGVLPPEALPATVPDLFFEELKKRNIEMIFDENEPLKHFLPPEPYTPGIFAKYGLTIFLLLIVVIIMYGIFWLILSL